MNRERIQEVIAVISKQSMNGRNRFIMLTMGELFPQDHLVRKIDAAIDLDQRYEEFLIQLLSVEIEQRQITVFRHCFANPNYSIKSLLMIIWIAI